MKQFLIGFVFGLFLILGCGYKADAQNDVDTNSLLWYVVNPQSPTDTSYIFGTIHLIPQKDFEITQRLKKALMSTRVLMTEVDLSNMAAAAQVASGMQLPAGETMKNMLDSSDYAILDSFLKDNLGVSMEMYNNQKPMWLMMTIVNVFVGGQPASYDFALTLMASQSGMKISGLETLQEQMEVLDRVPYSDMLKSIVEMVENIDKSRDDFNQMVAAYKNENIEVLSKLLEEYDTGAGESKLFLDDRNVKWIPTIKAAIEQNKTFVAVGAGHLFGKSGLIELMQNEGYEVKPVLKK